jgi:hypothetical protein
MSLDILRAVLIREYLILLSVSDSDGLREGSSLGSFPNCLLVASFKARSRFSGFFLSVLISLVYAILLISLVSQEIKAKYLKERYNIYNKQKEGMLLLYLKILQYIFSMLLVLYFISKYCCCKIICYKVINF